MKAIVKVLVLVLGVFASLNLALVPRAQAAMTADEYNTLIQALEATTPLPASEAPRFGSFYTVQHGEAWPPLPGDTMSLPYWDIGGGVFILDDTNVDSSALYAESASAGQFRLDDSFESDFSPMVFTTNQLWLEITGFTNHAASLVIHPPWNDTNLFYDLYFTDNPDVPWQFMMRCPYTNVGVPDLCAPEGFFRLGPATNGNLTVNSNVTALTLAQLLVPPGVTLTNVSYTGAAQARGTFTGGNGCGLPLDSGVILSSGQISNATGPNDDDGWVADDNGSSDLGQFGDVDLDNLVGNGPTHDAAVLEFDIISTNAFILGFQYVFASEEYPEYIGPYNDPMAIFVSTNRIGTNWINNITNDLALVPETTNVPVSVNNINGGCVDDASGNHDAPTNAQYYVDNHDPYWSAEPPSAVSAPVFNIQCDGMTVLLAVQAHISANVTNHVKIAIADYHDFVFDSDVFIKTAPPCQ